MTDIRARNWVERYEPSIADLEATADRLTGHGITGLIADDWPVLVAALEDYIAIRRSVADWDNKIKRAVLAKNSARTQETK